MNTLYIRKIIVPENKKKPGSRKNTAGKQNNKQKNKELVISGKNQSSETETADIIEKDDEAIDRNDKPMSIVGHLNEMRSRMIVSLVTILTVFLGSFFFLSEYILTIINKPYLKTGLKLNIFNISEGFVLRAKAALVAGIFVALPVIIYELWKYIVPAITKKNRKFIRHSVIASVLLMYAGICLTYFFLLPIAVQMLLKFTPENVNSIIGASTYLSFTVLFCLSMGVLCELPIVIMILTKIGLITPKLLTSKRKYAIVLIWIFAAILTPGPDVLSQALVAIPVMLLYEISIIISKVMVKRKQKYG
jgi:sec-independent protein translocase protein TatC